MSTAQSMTDVEPSAFGVRWMGLTQDSHPVNVLGITTILDVFSDSQ
jgi:hypothetical protein